MTKQVDASGKIVATQPNPSSAIVSVQESVQKTDPSVPLRRAYPRAELGDSGTRMLHGIITEEYNPQLQGIQGIRIYDEMRKSDGTVRAAMLATTLPIRRAQWFVNPSTNDQKDKDIAEFVEHALFDWLTDMTWDDVVRQALLMLAFGVMTFEKVYSTKDHEGKTYVTLKKLAPRLPKSILQWELPDQTFGIQQIRQDGVLALIPGSKLLIFVNEREGDNWWGTSMLRAAYKHWYYKNNFYKIDAVAFERQGLGVPKFKMPAGYTEADERKAIQAAQNLRASESAYLILPNTYEAEFMDMGARTTRDPESSINHHNKEILQSVLAQFLELGATKSGSGSRALSQDHSDLFLKALESIANTIIAEINKNLIPELVDMNFNDVTVYPVLDYSGITKVDVTALGDAYSSLVTAGALTPTNDDQQYLRAALGLPPRTQKDIDDADNSDPTMNDQVDHVNIEDDGQEDPAGPTDKAMEKTDPKKPTPKDNKQVDKSSVKKQPKQQAHDHFHTHLKRKFSDSNGFMSWRPLTFAEQKVDWQKIDDMITNIEDGFTVEATSLLNEAKTKFMTALHIAITNGDNKAISSLQIGFQAEYKKLVKDTMKTAYEYGKNKAATEIDVEVPPNNADTLSQFDLAADTIANKTISDLEAKAKLAAVNAMKKDTSPLQAAGDIDSTMDDAIDTSVDRIASVIVSKGMNNGRNDTFERNSDMVYALQRSEILDEVTCNFCLSMDGLVIEADDDYATEDIFHDNCRGIWVAILSDEQDPPEVTGVPENISDYYGGETNSLIQPPKPITRAGTLADAYVKSKQADKKK